MRHDEPDDSAVGIALAVLSLVVMPLLGWRKSRTAKALGSRALAADAKEAFVCAWLSVALLLGLGLNAWLGWWWADPVAGLAMLPFIVHEGLDGQEEARGNRRIATQVADARHCGLIRYGTITSTAILDSPLREARE